MTTTAWLVADHTGRYPVGAMVALTAASIALSIMVFIIYVGGFVLAVVAVLLAIGMMRMVQPFARSYFGDHSL
ncbi:hypothetical protein ACGE24_07680 [Corynebacterium kroppenstedtii]|uniref:hypothetical protein n=1 Tax=Corynebacterium sp. PCR 32 TaxID=3351342 RepID=UPI0030AADAC5